MVHHADGDAGHALLPGVVAAVESTGTGSNVVAVDMTTPLGTRSVHPGRLSVHHDPVEFDGQCWRCSY